MVEARVILRFDNFNPDLPADHRVVFSVNSKYYRIDLTEENLERMNEALQPFVDVAEPITVPGSLTSRNLLAKAATDADIREWARSQGLDVPDRGRVPRDLVHKYYSSR